MMPKQIKARKGHYSKLIIKKKFTMAPKNWRYPKELVKKTKKGQSKYLELTRKHTQY